MCVSITPSLLSFLSSLFFDILICIQAVSVTLPFFISGTDKDLDDEDKSVHSGEGHTRAAIGTTSSMMQETTNENDLQVRKYIFLLHGKGHCNIFLHMSHMTLPLIIWSIW